MPWNEESMCKGKKKKQKQTNKKTAVTEWRKSSRSLREIKAALFVGGNRMIESLKFWGKRELSIFITEKKPIKREITRKTTAGDLRSLMRLHICWVEMVWNS